MSSVDLDWSSAGDWWRRQRRVHLGPDWFWCYFRLLSSSPLRSSEQQYGNPQAVHVGPDGTGGHDCHPHRGCHQGEGHRLYADSQVTQGACPPTRSPWKHPVPNPNSQARERHPARHQQTLSGVATGCSTQQHTHSPVRHAWCAVVCTGTVCAVHCALGTAHRSLMGLFSQRGWRS
jgi:hypothetical protein